METQFIPGMDFFPLARKGAARAAVVCEGKFLDLKFFYLRVRRAEAGETPQGQGRSQTLSPSTPPAAVADMGVSPPPWGRPAALRGLRHRHGGDPRL